MNCDKGLAAILEMNSDKIYAAKFTSTLNNPFLAPKAPTSKITAQPIMSITFMLKPILSSCSAVSFRCRSPGRYAVASDPVGCEHVKISSGDLTGDANIIRLYRTDDF